MKSPFSTVKQELNQLPFDPEYTPGARNAVKVCLRIQPSEKVTVITDDATKEIAASVVHELERLGCPYHAWVLEEMAPRPLTDLPREVLEDLESSRVSIFAVQAQANELRSRMQMTDVVNRRKIRHAHMVNIEKQIMLQGMRADFLEVDDLTARVREIGVRVALGAERGTVVWMIVRDGLAIAVPGVIIGAPCAWAAARLVRAQLYGIAPGDPRTLLITAAISLTTALAASSLPALRASRVAPVEALREE